MSSHPQSASTGSTACRARSHTLGLLFSMVTVGLPVAAIAQQSTAHASITNSAGDPLTLGALLGAMRGDNPVLAAANSRVREAEAARKSSGAFGNPTLAYSVDQTPFPGGQPLVGMSKQTFITATFPLESFYQRSPRVTRATAELRAAELDEVSARQQVGLEAVVAFYRVAMAQVETETTRDLEGWLDSVVTYNRLRVAEGVTAESELIRATLERDRVALERSQQTAELVRARASLTPYLSASRRSSPNALATGTVIFSPLPFAMPAQQLPAQQLPAQQLPAQQLPAQQLSAAQLAGSAERPEVRAARERVLASAAQISAERSMILRELSATIGTMFTQNMTAMMAGVSLPLPLFDRSGGEVQRARAAREVAQFESANIERTVNAELQGAREAAQVLSAQMAQLGANDASGFLARAEESRRIALGAYREGAVPLFQVIDAARSWAEARVAFYRTLFAQHQSILALTVAQGIDLYTSPALSTAVGGSAR